jgi:arylsulfatase A-like enzyme
LPQVSAGPDNSGAQKGKEVVFSEVMGFTMVRNQRYKLAAEAVSLKPVEFFDLEDDPEELRNRVADPALQAVRDELLENHLKPHRRRLDEAGYRIFLETEAKRLKSGRGPLTSEKIQP